MLFPGLHDTLSTLRPRRAHVHLEGDDSKPRAHLSSSANESASPSFRSSPRQEKTSSSVLRTLVTATNQPDLTRMSIASAACPTAQPTPNLSPRKSASPAPPFLAGQSTPTRPSHAAPPHSPKSASSSPASHARTPNTSRSTGRRIGHLV